MRSSPHMRTERSEDRSVTPMPYLAVPGRASPRLTTPCHAGPPAERVGDRHDCFHRQVDRHSRIVATRSSARGTRKRRPTCGTSSPRLAEMNAQWNNAPDGSHAWSIAEQAQYERIGGVWISYDRPAGCGLVQTGQSINTGASVDFTWDFEAHDAQGFHAPGAANVVVPQDSAASTP